MKAEGHILLKVKGQVLLWSVPGIQWKSLQVDLMPGATVSISVDVSIRRGAILSLPTYRFR